MAYTWGIDHNTKAIGSYDKRGSGLTGTAGIKVVDSQLQATEYFLRAATRHAESVLHLHTLPQFYSLHGFTLEKLGADSFLRLKPTLNAHGLDSMSNN